MNPNTIKNYGIQWNRNIQKNDAKFNCEWLASSILSTGPAEDEICKLAKSKNIKQDSSFYEHKLFQIVFSERFKRLQSEFYASSEKIWKSKEVQKMDRKKYAILKTLMLDKKISNPALQQCLFKKQILPSSKFMLQAAKENVTHTEAPNFLNGCISFFNRQKIAAASIEPIATPFCFTIDLFPRPGLEKFPKLKNKKITADIATFSHLKTKGKALTEENLPNIFKLANLYTLDRPYAIDNHAPIHVGDIERPNHNGTHSARQTRLFEAILDVVVKKGTFQAQAVIASLTEDQILNLKLAAYFLRAGRVDETDFQNFYPFSAADYNKERSAQIYMAYARELGVAEKTIQWTKALIDQSCLPVNLLTLAIVNKPKAFLCHQMLSAVHELDLIRCYGHVDKRKTNAMLTQFISTNLDQIVAQLYNFSEKLCTATGCYMISRKIPADVPLFKKCSHAGDYCWNAVKQQALPQWK